MYPQNYYIQPAARLSGGDMRYMHDIYNGPAVLKYLDGLSFDALCSVRRADVNKRFGSAIDQMHFDSVVDTLIQTKYSRLARSSQALSGVNKNGFPAIDRVNQKPFLRTRRLICPGCGQDLTNDLMNQIEGNQVIDRRIITVVCPYCGEIIEGKFNDLCRDPLDIGNPNRHLPMASDNAARESFKARKRISKLLREAEDTSLADPPKVFDPYPVQTVKPVSVKVLPNEKPHESVSGWLKQPADTDSKQEDNMPPDLEAFKTKHVTSDNGEAEDAYDTYTFDDMIGSVLDSGLDLNADGELSVNTDVKEEPEATEIEFDFSDSTEEDGEKLDLDFEISSKDGPMDDFGEDFGGDEETDFDFEAEPEEGTMSLEDDYETVSLINGYLNDAENTGKNSNCTSDEVHISMTDGYNKSASEIAKDSNDADMNREVKSDFDAESEDIDVSVDAVLDTDADKSASGKDPFEITFDDIPL